MKLLYVVGARPNFMKVAPIMEAVAKFNGGHTKVEQILVHTGQHYSPKMSQLFFDQLGLPEPDVNLEVGSASHGSQTAQILSRFEETLIEHQPDMVIVVGDVNSTMACAIDAKKLNIPVAHVEAGLRSGDRTMPEEINRLITDSISDLFFVTDDGASANLLHEGIPRSKIYFSGNVMIDTLLKHLPMALEINLTNDLDIEDSKYAVVTLHRPSNVDNRETITEIVESIEFIARDLAVIFPMHPRTADKLVEFGILSQLQKHPNIRIIEPLGYLEFMSLVSRSTLVISDSGGIQEETTVLGIPCLTCRKNTERPITIEEGTNHLVGNRMENILSAYQYLKAVGFDVNGSVPDRWDGKAGERIAETLISYLSPIPNIRQAQPKPKQVNYTDIKGVRHPSRALDLA